MATSGSKRKLEKSYSEADETSPNKNSCTERNDKLEDYLADIYSKYCKITIDEKEVEFIRIGIENLTIEYLEKTYRRSPCKDKLCKINKCCELELVKVGSFYEGTRNGFPDEFDFIAVLGTVAEEPDENTYIHLLEKEFLRVCTNCEIYTSEEFPKFSLQFRYTYGSRSHGKATHLEYVYKRDKEEIIIDVDIVIALRCYKTENFYTLADIFNKDFCEELIKTGSFFFIYTGTFSYTPDETEEGAKIITNRSGPWEKTITETETRFVRDILSKTHRKVYRILKYIINGPFGENLFKYLNDVEHFQSALSELIGTGFSISSYVIKIAMIHHHYNCKTDLEDKIGECVLDILKNLTQVCDQVNEAYIAMHSLHCLSQVGPLIGRGNYDFLRHFYWCLLAFRSRLMSLKSSDEIMKKCNHDLENSFLEMALRLPMFTDYEKFLMNLESKFSDQSTVRPFRPTLKLTVKKLKEYNERRKKVLDCPWCDYQVFVKFTVNESVGFSEIRKLFR